ncbi:MAG: hypothetical protein RLZ10_2530, partial [Bacteroidota bacterium]
SYKTSYQNSGKKLIESLIENNSFSSEQILLVIGGYDKREEFEYLNCKSIKVNHNSYDHTGLIEVIESGEQSKYWFSTHDTCIAGSNFLHSLLRRKVNQDFVAMTEMGWLNMGIFSQKFLIKNKPFILSLKNCSKIRAILSERTFTRLGKYQYLTPNSKVYRSNEDQNIYEDNKKRTVLYFEDLDFYKYQSYEAVSIMKPNFTEHKKEDLF